MIDLVGKETGAGREKIGRTKKGNVWAGPGDLEDREIALQNKWGKEERGK